MPMLGLDANETEPFESHGVVWHVGSIPWGKLAELRIDLAEAWAAEARARRVLADVPATDVFDHPGARPLREALLRLTYLYAEVVRWSLRRWDGLDKLPPTTETATHAGASYAVLSRPVVDVLCRVAGGNLVEALALHALKANAVSAEDLLGFK